MTEIEVNICCGTNCYIMGGSELQLIKERLSAATASVIKLKGENCGGHCHDFANTKKPPFAWINGVTIENATLEKLVKRINKRIN